MAMAALPAKKAKAMGIPLLSPEEGLVLPVVEEDPPLSSKPPSGQVKSLPPPGMEGLAVAGGPSGSSGSTGMSASARVTMRV